MHLVAAALLNALLGRKQRAGRDWLPNFPDVLETAHALPGRLRLRAPALIGRRGAADQLERSLMRLGGVRAAEASAVTGSLLIQFAPDRVSADMLVGAVVRLLALEKDIERPPPSYVGGAIRNAGESLNSAIRQQTGGVVDLWTTVTLLLATTGVRRLAAGNQFGWSLLWWAYRSAFPGERGGE
jgi:hypothetical protein